MSTDPQLLKRDQKLVDSVLEGSVDAWHELVGKYSGLIFSVVRRHLRSEDDDEQRNVFVEILRKLLECHLKAYDGRSRLSTWIVVVSRSQCVDHLRSLNGRRRIPRGVQELEQFDQEVYRLHFLDGLAYGAICERLSGNGEPLPVRRVAAAMERIEPRLNGSLKSRLAYDLGARSSGVESGRLLEYLDDLRVRHRSRDQRESPEFELLEREAQAMHRRVRACLKQLPGEDRQALKLRFYEGHSADAIAAEMGLGPRRRAYTIVERALGRLRRLLEVGEMS